MKRVLALTLVLVLALASSAMADVTFSGSFKATAKQDSFKIFQGEYKLEPDFEFTISASGKNTTTVSEEVAVEVAVLDEDGEETGETITELQTQEEEITNWDFTAGLSLDSTTFKVGKYKLGLYDEWFTGYAWGNGYELKDEATYFGMITAGKAASTMRARLILHVMDYADVTLDFDPGDNIRAFVQGDVAGFDLGLAFARKNWTDKDKVSNTIVAQAGYDVPAGDIDVRLQGAVGVNLAEEIGLGFGLSARSDVTEQINVGASVTHGNKNWVGESTDVATDSTIIKADATYTETNFQVEAKGSVTLAAANTNTVELTGIYRMSDTLVWGDLFKAGEWHKNDALAVRAFANLTEFKLGEVGVDVASPVVQDMVWAKAYGRYGEYTYDDETNQVGVEDGKPVYKKESAKGFKAGADAYIQATQKLVVKPFVYFEQIGKVIGFGTDASYKIGLSDTTLDFTVKKVMAEDVRASQAGSLIQASVKVPF